MTDEELIRLYVQTRNAVLFRLLADRHRAALTAFLTRLAGRHDAERIAREVLILAERHADRWDGRPVEQWLQCAAVRRACGQLGRLREMFPAVWERLLGRQF